jgi:pimeloyl-ACP methyl ester carboxylesterase
VSEAAYSDGYWTSEDGLRLHYRDYAGPSDRPPLLCIPGLTRNARDFEPIFDEFAGAWRIIAIELRGRGESDYAKESASYNPMQYVADIQALLEQAKIDRFVAIGTSLGGIVTMLFAAVDAGPVAGVVLNDIGPVIEPEGLARIREYVGQGRSFPTWMHAARALRETQGKAFPSYGISDWLKMAKQLMTLGGSGRIAFDYDMKIAEPFDAPAAQAEVDLWPAYRALAGRPVLSIRGELSDILSGGTQARMAREIEGADLVTVPGIGHAPTLGEPEARAAIGTFLAGLA